MKLDHSFMEKIILFHCLTNEAYLTSVIDFLTPGLFDNKNNRDIIDIISNFHDRNKTCPNITEVKALLTTDELKSSFKKVVEEFTHLDKKYNTEELERNTEQFIKEKGVYNTLLETAKMVSEGGADTELILNKFEKACNINLTTDHGIELYGDIDRIVDDLNKTDPVISSGWEWMDKILGGGFKRDGRAIYIYAGRPNVGKSSLLNKLTKSNRSVVSEIAGTTVDPVDEIVMINDEAWNFIDTAGIRRRVRESSGYEYYASLRTQAALERAEIALLILESSENITDQDRKLINLVTEAGRALVLVFNKWDLFTCY
jgi:small GTP-binding protein